MFTRAIVRRPAPTLADGITTAVMGPPDYQKALDQHRSYVEALQTCGLDVTILDALPEFPDSVFIEDVALLTPECAILARPGAVSRRGEVDYVRNSIEPVRDSVYEINAPGTLEAGDIMMVASHYYIGLSCRTNRAGATQLSDFLNRHAMSSSTVCMEEFLHLKTGLSYLENNNLLVSGEFVNRQEFLSFNQIIVDADEAYAANSVWINGKVLTPAGYPKTHRKIRAAGYDLLRLQMSEFQKLDGGLSCLSIRH